MVLSNYLSSLDPRSNIVDFAAKKEWCLRMAPKEKIAENGLRL